MVFIVVLGLFRRRRPSMVLYISRRCLRLPLGISIADVRLLRLPAPDALLELPTPACVDGALLGRLGLAFDYTVLFIFAAVFSEMISPRILRRMGWRLSLPQA